MDMDMVRRRKDPWGLSPVGGPWEAWGSLMDLCGRSRPVGPPRSSCDAYVGCVCHCHCGGDRSSRHPVRLVWVNGSFGCRTIAARTRDLILDTILEVTRPYSTIPAATVRWHPPEDGATQLTVAHFKAGGPVYDDALSQLGDTQRPLLLMLPTGIAAALRQELDGCEGLRVGWEAVADGTLLALLHRDTANGCQWDALTPHLTGRHVYMASPPQGHPRPAWDDLIAAFHDHGILPGDTWQEVQRKTLGKDYRRRVRARLLEIRDPLRQRWDDLWLRHLDPWSPPSHLPHTCRLCGECDTVSSAAATGANRCERCAQVAACPWPEPPAGPRRRTEEEALRRRIEGAHTPSHEQAGPAGAALLWIHVHLRDPTSIAQLSHVFAP